MKFSRNYRYVLIAVLLSAAPIFGVPGDETRPQYRRPIHVDWDDSKATGAELTMVEFYTAGHHLPNGQDVRVFTAGGGAVPSRVLSVGPGDMIRVAFRLEKRVRDYNVTFGSQKPPTSRPAAQELRATGGLIMEMKQWAGGEVGNFQQMEGSWIRSEGAIGGTLIASPFLGINPFGDQQSTISRLTGTLSAPADGDYTFAMTVDDKGALYIDGKPVLFAEAGPADSRINAVVHLTRGAHEFLFYHINAAADGRFTVAWKPPAATEYQLIGPEALGKFFNGKAGPLEQFQKTLTADFTVQYLAESFYANGYSHRYKFAARVKRGAEGRAKFEWDFGDGQTSTAAQLEHVYLNEGIYPVKLTTRIGGNSDSQTTKISVSRDYAHIAAPVADEPSVHSIIAASYKVASMPPQALARAVWLHLRSEKMEPMLQAAMQLAQLPTHPNVDEALDAMREATRFTLVQHRNFDAVKIWEKVPAKSDLQPKATKQLALLLLWRIGNFARAAKVLEPLASVEEAQSPLDPSIRLVYAQALLLDGKADAAKKIFQEFPVTDLPERQAAISGAMARTVEFYLTEKDWQAGEDAWNAWQNRYPADFLGGYSALLKMRLLELREDPVMAARVAEAFAMAMPSSSYAPQLLDRASKLLAERDSAKSQALRKVLKERYPEDPLSQ